LVLQCGSNLSFRYARAFVQFNCCTEICVVKNSLLINILETTSICCGLFIIVLLLTSVHIVTNVNETLVEPRHLCLSSDVFVAKNCGMMLFMGLFCAVRLFCDNSLQWVFIDVHV
jgi:hypothetical protein